jgi:exopolysaccharide biosynthesis polyprenyl glycosylphosphotransferase
MNGGETTTVLQPASREEKGSPDSRFVPKEKRHRFEEICRFWLVATDVLAILGGLVGAFFIRFSLPWDQIPFAASFVPEQEIDIHRYQHSMIFGGAMLLALLLALGAYQGETLLRFRRSFPIVVKALLVWLIAYPGVALVLEFDERLSRVFVVVSFLSLMVTTLLGRFVVQRLLSSLGYTAAFRQRLLFVDWTENVAHLAGAIAKDAWHPYDVVGCAPPPTNKFTLMPPPHVQTLGSYAEVNVLSEVGVVDIVILGDGKRSEQDVLALARQCEKSMVQFMVVPSGFQILLSGLELTTVSSVPLLGVTKLPLDHPVNATMKRIVDICGALVGCAISLPIIAVFCALVYLESPGPVFYRQVRVGRRGRNFEIIKIRSMKLDAEKESGARWASKVDDRRLRVGTFMRKWNVDELPQFWNVLKGDLSLVGPRPERPELIKQFRETIPFYNARHNIVPGMTGWAAVNGFRGDTDLNERIRCDIYYIENWSPILDFQIMLMTFFRWEGAH